MFGAYEKDRRFRPRRKDRGIKNLWALNGEILNQLVAGRKPKDIARELGITTQTVSNTRNSDLGRERLRELAEQRMQSAVDIGERIKEFAPEALQLHEEIISGEYDEASIALRAKIASEWLGRAGYGEIKKSANVSARLSPEDIERIKERARNGARQIGLIDVDFKEVD